MAGPVLTKHRRACPRGVRREATLGSRRSELRRAPRLRTELANVCHQMAAKCGEPPLGEQA